MVESIDQGARRREAPRLPWQTVRGGSSRVTIMPGWYISIYKLKDDPMSPAEFGDTRRE
jgi:hypothetical protein